MLSYDAVNIGGKDLRLGLSVLRSYADRIDFPVISTNLTGDAPFWQSHVIREVGGVRVAIFGVVDPNFVPNGLRSAVRPCIEVVTEKVAALKSQADIIVAMCQLGNEGTLALVKEVSGIDVALIGGGHKNSKPEKIGETIVAGLSPKGKSIGELEIVWDVESKSIAVFDGEIHSLDKNIPDDPEMTDLIRSEGKKREAELAYLQKQEQEAEQKRFKNLLEMKPAEFLEKWKRDNKKGGGEDENAE